MSLDFEKYAAKGNEFVNLVTEDLELSWDKAGRIIRAGTACITKPPEP